MSSILSRLKEVIDLLSELNAPPSPPATLMKGLDVYSRTLIAAREKLKEDDRWRDLLAELANSREEEARKKIDHLSDAEFKAFCAVNKIKPAKAKKGKTVRGKVVQKAVRATQATKTKPGRPAIPERREPNIIVPDVSAREATTEIILNQAVRLKGQATI